MNHKLALWWYVALASLASNAILGCHKNEPPIDNADEETVQLAADGNESSVAAAQSTHIANIVFSAVTHGDPSIAVNDVVSAPRLWPSGCVARLRDPVNPFLVHLLFNDCDGPFGLVHLNGGEDVTFATSMNGHLEATFASVNLTANGDPIVHTATADITIMNNDRQVAWDGDWSRTNDAGVFMHHHASFTILVDVMAGCSTSNGTAMMTVNTRRVDTTTRDYKVCRGPNGVDSCPVGTVTHMREATGRSITIDFDGSADAEVEAAGSSFAVPLVCGS